MHKFTRSIESVDVEGTDLTIFKRVCVGCIILTKKNKILLQLRDNNWRTFPGRIATFGGAIEPGEGQLQALIRELKEELGAEIASNEVVYLGAITEKETNYTQLIYTYFWHDQKNSITGCYECQPIYFDDVESALADTKLMDDVRWLLKNCKARRFLK